MNTVVVMNTDVNKTCFPPPPADDHRCHSAELVGSNDYLLTEILVRLPAAKYFFRFKIVSKQWLSLLTHPSFTRRLSFDQLSVSSGLYYHELHVSYDVRNPTIPPFRDHLEYFSPDDHTDGIRIVQSCNGLLLCCCNKDYKSSDKYYVFNPTTKKVSPIPPVINTITPYDPSELIRFMGLAYHPTECVHFKLVCILRAGKTPSGGFSEDGDRMYDIQIYSSETGEWKVLNQTFTPCMYTEFKYGVYWDGAFHWAPSCSNPMYLSLDTEEILDLPLPSPMPVRKYPSYYTPYTIPLYFGESRGHLHSVDIVDEKKPLSLNVFEMLKDHSGWFIKYQLDLHELSVAYPNMKHNETWRSDKHVFRVLDVVRGEEEQEDTFMVVKVVDDIKRYNFRDKTFKQLYCIPDMIEKFTGSGTKTFAKTDHRFVGHRCIETKVLSNTT